MKVNRVINFGCSHAYGSEMGGYRDDTGHIDLNYGNIVAKHLGVNFEIAAVPGSSNEYILNAVTEKVQQGDLCLLSWTNFRRAMYQTVDDVPEIPSHNFTEYEVIKVMNSVARKLSRTSLGFNTTMIKGMFKNESLNYMHDFTKKVDDLISFDHKIPFVENKTHELVETIAKYNVFYAWEFLPMFIKYLQLYNSVNAIVQNKGAKAINFIFHENKYILKRMETYDNTHELEINLATKLYNNWKNDPTRIQHYAPNYWAMNHIAGNITGVPEFEYPGDRQGHYGPDEHKVVGDILIKKCKELKCQ